MSVVWMICTFLHIRSFNLSLYLASWLVNNKESLNYVIKVVQNCWNKAEAYLGTMREERVVENKRDYISLFFLIQLVQYAHTF